MRVSGKTGGVDGKTGEGVKIGEGVETNGNVSGATGEGSTTGDTGRLIGFFCSMTKKINRLVKVLSLSYFHCQRK